MALASPPEHIELGGGGAWLVASTLPHSLAFGVDAPTVGPSLTALNSNREACLAMRCSDWHLPEPACVSDRAALS